MQKAYLKVTALEYIDWFPGFLKSELKDRHGKIHEFVEKIPVMCGSDAHFDAASLYPVEITFNCVVLNSFEEKGSQWCLISTEKPYNITSEEGKTEFEVNKNQIILIE